MRVTTSSAAMAGVILLLTLMTVGCSPSETAGSTTTQPAGTTTETTEQPTTTHTPTTTSSPPIPTTTTTKPLTTTTASATTVPADTNQLASGSGCTPGTEELPDGEWFGLVDELTDTKLFFDLACWFTDDAAVIASAEDGEESPPPNDYYVRNANNLIRELEVNSNVPVEFYPDGDPGNYFITEFENWSELADSRGLFLDVWVTIEDGEVTKITEQWVP